MRIQNLFALVALCAASACAERLSMEEADLWIEQVKAEGCGPDAGSGGQGGENVVTPPECTPESVAMDCASPPSPECGSAICIEGKCALEIKVGPIASQKYGDCKTTRCNQLGELEHVDDGEDVFNDGKQCTVDFCGDGAQGAFVRQNLNLPDGVPCPEAGDGYCYQGKCVECVQILPQATCNAPGQVCDQTMCEPFTAQCMGGGCGGVCAPCKSGLPCVTAADCLSSVCTNGICQLPSCNDGVKNDGESGLDCGAPSCPLCPANQGCSAPSDCESKVCMVGICQAPTCFDAEENGDETGIDCGGAKCGPCLESPGSP